MNRSKGGQKPKTSGIKKKRLGKKSPVCTAVKQIAVTSDLKRTAKRPIKPHPGLLIPLELKLKPMDAFYSQLDQRKLSRSRFDALSLRSSASFVNSACLSVSLSDTLLNVFRDINFDSCTLCACTHHTIKGFDYPIYICQDIFGVYDENELNVYNSSSGCLSQSQQTIDPNLAHGQDMNTSFQGYNRCTCGFSSIKNRAIMAKMTYTVRLNDLIEFMNQLEIKPTDKDRLLPYSNLVSTHFVP